ncbi:MAG: type II toxin-antitoxin system RelE/ParE family toxin [Crocinitomicaceae bacterium]|nr:type II toxin-antitoxin system RelE/ParE family toxin [Crocinitomicaceae bacterium]
MKNGYRIFWTDHALNELKTTFDFINEHWTQREIKNLAQEIELVVELLSRSPKIFPESSSKKGIYKALVTPLNTIYFRVNGNSVEILSFFANRKNPSKLKAE